MKTKVTVIAVGALSIMAVCAATDKPETTMQVARCLALDEKGAQCRHQADAGKKYCWRHRGFVKAMNDTVDDTGKGASKSWDATRQWSTNTWQKTKSGARSALDSTKEAVNEACENFVEMFGGNKKAK